MNYVLYYKIMQFSQTIKDLLWPIPLDLPQL